MWLQAPLLVYIRHLRSGELHLSALPPFSRKFFATFELAELIQSLYSSYMDSGAINLQTQTSEDSQTHSNCHSEQQSPSPRKSSFNPDCLRLVGLYRCGSLTNINAILEIFKLASHADQSEFRGRSVAELVAPYH
jgi:hypothetical protein